MFEREKIKGVVGTLHHNLGKMSTYLIPGRSTEIEGVPVGASFITSTLKFRHNQTESRIQELVTS